LMSRDWCAQESLPTSQGITNVIDKKSYLKYLEIGTKKFEFQIQFRICSAL